jgi:FKBP-type peptidyl-prolyl cis-trans isomerase FkpA
MMRKIGILVALAYVLASCGGKANEEEKLELKTFKDKLSYILGAQQAKMITESGDPNLDSLQFDQMLIGFNQGLSMKKAMDPACKNALEQLYGPYGQDFNAKYVKSGSECIGKIAGSVFFQTWTKKGVLDQIDMNIAKKGFEHGLYKKDTLIDQKEMMTMINDFLSGINKKSGAKLLSDAKKLPNAKEIDGGLVIQTLQEGTGGSPKADDDIEVNYIVMNADGDTIENSLEMSKRSGQPTPAFNLAGMIPGWGIAFPNLKKGGKYMVFVPWNLAYGEQSQCETLKFYIEFNNYGPKGTLAKQEPMPGLPPQ